MLVFCTQAQEKKQITSEDYDRAVSMLYPNTSKLLDNDIYPQWLPDGRIWYRNLTKSNKEFKLYNPETNQFLVTKNQQDLVTKGQIDTKSKGDSYTEILSPNEKYVAFVKDWNLWIRELATQKETQLTTDGIKNYGYATDNAGWKHTDRPILSWSPDSKKIATFKQDQRHVSDMYLVKTQVGAPELEAWKYPLPSDKDIIRIERVVVHLKKQPDVVFLELAPDARRGTLCDDISCEGGFDDVEWSTDSKSLVFVSTTRDHKKAYLRIADAKTGNVKELYKEVVPTQYESGRGAVNWKYLDATKEFIWYSQKSDWGHLYLHDATTGKLKNQITSGKFVVKQVLKVDKTKRIIYFTASHHKQKGNPYYTYLYKVRFDGSDLTMLTPEYGNHSIRFSPNKKFFIDSYSQVTEPPVHQVKNLEGSLLTILEKTDITRLKASGWVAPNPFTVKSANGNWDLYGLLFLPSQFSKNTNTKLPVVVYIYPGPQGGSVSSWDFRIGTRDCQALAELGFAVVQLEGSCNPGRSKSFHDACYGNMGENTLPDQVYGLQQLQKQYPFMDLDRVGIWGHSGGGYASTAAMFHYPDFFKVAISESGNHDNRNYEDDWGERYIGLETYDNNGVSNYQVQANQEYAKNLKGKLWLIHGGMDDNVPPYNTYLVVDALIKANKDFDFLLIPNARHGYGKDASYIMRRRWDYFVKHLMGGTPPREYKVRFTPDIRN
ncbi:S9 family peptidase [Ochrovirga pacifica]|uniref:S9 family peptidase n=1 Tax=Ochrovirga pacifica TaxID=1042376 RepID=UPI0002FEF8E8|nr:S9 family peptidase [Ochrovirga pacifica]